MRGGTTRATRRHTKCVVLGYKLIIKKDIALFLMYNSIEGIMIIYLITNKINGKQYVGLKFSKDNFNNYWGSGTYIKNAIKKYGVGNFKKNIIEDGITNVVILNTRERYWIQKYKTIHPYGYNLSSGGERIPGYIHCEATKKQIGLSNSIALLGNKISENTKKKISQKLLNVKKTKEHKKNISLARIGMKFSEEHIKNMSLCRIGKKHSEEHKRKIGEKSKGHKTSIETKNKMRDKAIKRMQNLSIRLNLSHKLKGHIVTEETRNKIRKTLAETRKQKNEQKISQYSKNIFS